MTSWAATARRAARGAVDRVLSRTDFRLVRAGGHVKAPLPRPRPVRVVVATQLDPARFRADSLLGRSLATVPPSLSPTLTVHSGNTGADAQGLPALYNRALDAASLVRSWSACTTTSTCTTGTSSPAPAKPSPPSTSPASPAPANPTSASPRGT